MNLETYIQYLVLYMSLPLTIAVLFYGISTRFNPGSLIGKLFLYILMVLDSIILRAIANLWLEEYWFKDLIGAALYTVTAVVVTLIAYEVAVIVTKAFRKARYLDKKAEDLVEERLAESFKNSNTGNE